MVAIHGARARPRLDWAHSPWLLFSCSSTGRCTSNATLTDHVIEASLGYFTNPIVTVLLGVLVLGERLRPMQRIAVGVSGIAVLVLAIGYG